ncbi:MULTISPECIES: hypothetical protein [unclassified Nocardioides]|uniref:hypothetical protein n=1 Tax=unclassified Nocardioides TaxID=2615069 RepID=UPI000702D689|nr:MULTISPECIES: hypothetical protein [unclassified Nocardioides]KRC51410.1 hypothetical protein ASE19_15095 [Nocardioides sp. Root79]KRC69020.1 hypothetical protein ASE20_15750 [Nocardioides sp. Root240]
METSPALAALTDQLQGEEYDVSEPLPGVLHVRGRFSNPERIALRAAADAGDLALAVWATSHHDDWALVCWERPELVTITQKGATPQRWRHRRIPATLRPDAQTFLEGASSPFDIVTRPKHQPTEAARELLARFGITDPPPPGWVPPVVEVPVVEVPVVRKTTVPAAGPGTKRASAPRAPKAPAKPVKPEPTVAVCPNCFMAIPATGVCDNCG